MDESYDAYAEAQAVQDANYAEYLEAEENQTKMADKLNLYQKLLEIQKSVMGLGKDKQATSYKYVTGDKVLGEIKPLMNKYGLLLKQEILSIENVRQDYTVGANTDRERIKSEILSKVMMRFTWVDSDSGDKDENLFGANGQNDWDKGIGSGLTYGERYFLLKYFHIATDEDDIDNPDRKPDEKQEAATKPLQPSKEFDNDNRPWLSDKAFEDAKTRMTAGEKELYAKIDTAYRIKKEFRTQLKQLA